MSIFHQTQMLKKGIWYINAQWGSHARIQEYLLPRGGGGGGGRGGGPDTTARKQLFFFFSHQLILQWFINGLFQRKL